MRTPDGQLTPNTVSPEPGHAGKSAAAKEATLDDTPGTDGSTEGPIESAMHAALDRLSVVVPPAAIVSVDAIVFAATREGRRVVRRVWCGEFRLGTVNMRTQNDTAAAVADKLLSGWDKVREYGYDDDGRPTAATFEKLREANAKGEAALYTTGGANPND